MKEPIKDQNEPAKKTADQDRTVQKAKERWEGEGGSAPGKLNQDDSAPSSPPADGANLKS